MSGFFPLWPRFAPRRDVVSSHNYRNAGSLQFATTWGNGQEKFWPASSSRSAARGENRVRRFFHSGPRCQSLFVVSPGQLGPRTGFADPGESDLAPSPGEGRVRCPATMVLVMQGFPLVQEGEKAADHPPLWPHVHRSCRRAIQTARLQPPSPSWGHTRL
jgi:hypothetical protein